MAMGSSLMKYEAQILNPLPPNVETLIRYGPPETLEVTNNSA
jgi:hypothetical protein